MAVELYNSATFDAENPEKEEGKLNIIEFIIVYNQMYYFQTSRWVENKIEEYLTRSKLSKEEWLQIFAWKTNMIDMQKSQGEKRFCFRGSEKDKSGMKKWVVDDNKETATSSTRRRIDPHDLYVFLDKVQKQKEAYCSLKEKLENDCENRDGVLFEQKKSILEVLTLNGALPENIGAVYLITFFYFITQGDEPIYDYFAMKALDAIYPDESKNESSVLGSQVINRADPMKDENLIIKCPVYMTYKKKLHDFIDEYNEERVKNRLIKVSYNCRDIDRALWVYGHFFK